MPVVWQRQVPTVQTSQKKIPWPHGISRTPLLAHERRIDVALCHHINCGKQTTNCTGAQRSLSGENVQCERRRVTFTQALHIFQVRQGHVLIIVFRRHPNTRRHTTNHKEHTDQSEARQFQRFHRHNKVQYGWTRSCVLQSPGGSPLRRAPNRSVRFLGQERCV